MKKILSIYCMLLLCVSMHAGDGGGMVSTSQTGGRYEIIQTHALRFTFMLDKFTGSVFCLEEPYSSSGDYKWKRVFWIGDDTKSLKNVNTINYQLFMSGISFRYTILTNIHTGKSWIMYEDSKYGYFFAPIIGTLSHETEKESSSNSVDFDIMKYNDNIDSK